MPNSSEIFGSHVFDTQTMRACLSRRTYQALKRSIEGAGALTLDDANEIAHAMMEWAKSLNASHYTHWFQPMTGRTAQKHMAFLTFDEDLFPIDRFSGSQLIQSEPDASSFPSGGMRSTFEARGYTAWDPSSPAFVMKAGDVSVLYIPSVFFSYTGHALDRKTPLLRSEKEINRAAEKALSLLNGEVPGVFTTVGAEQEFFLVDGALYERRPDLIMTGRTIQGHRPPKGQQLEDHYFGAIKDRVLTFMEDVEVTLYRLGVPCKTRHNEVAPHQYEMAPVFQRSNLAADHNQLIMEVIPRVAREHGLAAILHEKPFQGVNGSGKHVNWSLQTETGRNLLEPGDSPHKNLQFLYFLVATVHAIYRRGDVLRSAIASAGNDHRLGANEAPPAIMSVFLGGHISEILDRIEARQDFQQNHQESIDLGLSNLPHVVRHTTDRNRTSPFAFTGNKFEFRSVGSSQPIAIPVAFLNAAVAESLDEMNALLEQRQESSDASVLSVLQHFIARSKPIRFEGNNYSKAWSEEAARRGISNLRSTPEALGIWKHGDTRAFITKLNILTEHEIEARLQVKLEGYCKALDIEAGTMLSLVDNRVLPAAFRHQALVAGAIESLASARSLTGMEAKDSAVGVQSEYLRSLSSTIAHLLEDRRQLENALIEARQKADVDDRAFFFAQEVKPLMESVRDHSDALEAKVDARAWSLPTYYELLNLM